MQRKMKIAIVLLALSSLISTTFAVLLVTHEINTTLIIKPKVSMGVFDVDGYTQLNSIDLGQFELGSAFYFPGHSETTPTQAYFVNNTDQVSFYVSFDIQNPDPHIQWNFAIKRGDQVDFTWLTAGAIYQYPIETPRVNPNPLTHYAYLYFAVTIGAGASFGTYTPTIVVSAFDSATG